MKIKINGVTLTNAIAQIVKVTGAKHLSMKAEDDKLIISGSEKGRMLSMSIEAAVKEEGGFTAIPDVLTGVVRSRKEVILTKSADESMVVVRSGNYEAEITILPFEDISIEEPSGVELDMADAELRVLLDVCNRAQLTAPYMEGSPSLPLHVNMSETGTHVASLDSYHIASVRTKQVTKEEELDLILPAGALSMVTQASNGGSYRIILSESVVYADNETFKLSLPLEQAAGNNLGLKNVSMMNNAIRKSEEVTAVKVDLAELEAILNNIYAVSEQGVAIVFTVGKNELKVSTSTSYGSANDKLTAEVKGKPNEYKFNPALVSEIFSKLSGDEVELNFLPKFMYINVRNGETSSMFIILRTS